MPLSRPSERHGFYKARCQIEAHSQQDRREPGPLPVHVRPKDRLV